MGIFIHFFHNTLQLFFFFMLRIVFSSYFKWIFLSLNPIPNSYSDVPDSLQKLILKKNLSYGISFPVNILPKKVFEMYSDTWFPDRLISERCVSSRFSILLNCL